MPIPTIIIGIRICIISIRIRIIRIWSGIGVNRRRRYWTNGDSTSRKKTQQNQHSNYFSHRQSPFVLWKTPVVSLAPLSPPILNPKILRTKSLISFSYYIKRMGLKSVDIGVNNEGGLAFQQIFKVICHLWFFTSIPLHCIPTFFAGSIFSGFSRSFCFQYKNRT